MTGMNTSTGPVRLMPRMDVAPSPLEHCVHDPKRGADREQVHHRSDRRNKQAPEDNHEQQKGDDHDGGDEQRQFRGEDRLKIVIRLRSPHRPGRADRSPLRRLG